MAFYRGRYTHHQLARGAQVPQWRKPRNCADAKYLAGVWIKRAHDSRLETARYREKIQQRSLRERNDWTWVVHEVQKAYPNTEAWLLSCSASEGGHGRWVPNSQGSGVGGWLQFMPGTWSGFYHHAVEDVTARRFLVPSSSASWYSPLGQALAGAWGITHGMEHHWSGQGCH